MGAVRAPDQFVSEEAFLARERLSLERHEYFQGTVTPLPRATIWHSRLVANVGTVLNRGLRSAGGMVLMSNMRIHVPRLSFFTYPDVVALRHKPQLRDEEQDVLLNPALLVEVLWAHSRPYDLGDKALRYHAIPSLLYYLAIDSSRVYALLHARGERPGEWLLTEFLAMEDIIKFPAFALGVELSLRDIYEEVELDPSSLRVA